MFSVKIIAVGKKKSELQVLEEEYARRLAAFCKFSFETIAPSGTEEEGIAILKKIQLDDFAAVLDEKGKQYTSQAFADWISVRRDRGEKLVFLIGGAYGISGAVKERSQIQISLSAMTFPHQLVRVFILEQLYRAFTIIKGMDYHHD